jgi:glycosyltransferase involved in cell wall biosynthesis
MAFGDESSPEFEQMKRSNLSPIGVPPPDRRKSGLKFYARLFLNIFSSLPYIVTSHYATGYQARFDELIGTGAYDCVLCEWTPYVNYIRGTVGPRKIISAHNIESSIWRGYKINERNPLKRLYIANQAAKVGRFERRCFKWADGATAVSESDASKLQALGLGYRVEVVENGVDLDYFRPQQAKVEENMLVFTGSMDWRPNQDAARYFVKDILPMIKRRRKGIEVVFVGRNPSRKTSALGRVEGVTITGTVDDVRPFIARAAAYVVPLRIGGGSRLKILEAMAMGKPVISTPIGAEGLRVKDRENIVISEHPRDFAEQVLRVLDDKSYRDRLAENGRRTIEKYYRWEGLGRKLSDYICSVAYKD